MQGRAGIRCLLLIVASVAAAIVSGPIFRSLGRWGWPEPFALVALAIGLGVGLTRLKGPVGPIPRAPWGPVAITCVGAFAAVAALGVIGSPLLHAAFVGITLYGVAGLWGSASWWRSLMAPVVVVLSALPFGQRAEDWLGLPARLTAAAVSSRVASRLGVAVDSAETVLIFENGLTDVAAACAGLRGFWTAVVLLMFVSALERRRLGSRLALLVAVTLAALLAVNILRIVSLIVIAFVLDAGEAARLIHEPLGLTFFVAVVAGALLALRRWVPAHVATAVERSPGEVGGGVVLAPQLVVAVAVTVAAVGIVTMGPALSVSPPPIALPNGMQPSPAALIPAEAILVERLPRARIDKVRFDHEGVQGQLILMQADTWRAQHPPEVCLRMAGHRITGAKDVALGRSLRVRLLEIDGGRRLAAYWYQSRRSASPDLWSKVRSTWFGEDLAWVMVSFLFDSGDSSARLPRPTLAAVHAAVGDALEREKMEGGSRE